jgi:hypothetical protein
MQGCRSDRSWRHDQVFLREEFEWKKEVEAPQILSVIDFSRYIGDVPNAWQLVHFRLDEGRGFGVDHTTSAEE